MLNIETTRVCIPRNQDLGETRQRGEALRQRAAERVRIRDSATETQRGQIGQQTDRLQRQSAEEWEWCAEGSAREEKDDMRNIESTPLSRESEYKQSTRETYLGNRTADKIGIQIKRLQLAELRNVVRKWADHIVGAQFQCGDGAAAWRAGNAKPRTAVGVVGLRARQRAKEVNMRKMKTKKK